MKLDERTVIPTPREGNHDGNKDARSPSENHNHNSSSTHHRSYSNSHTIDHFSTFDHNKSPPRAEADHSDRSSHYAHIPSQSADSHFNRQKPISLEGISLNEREKKWWDELRETAGNLADFASFVHRTGRIPPRNDLDWARSNFQLFAENMSALQMVSGVLRGEGPRYPEAGLNTLSISNSSRYGTRLMSQSPTLEGGNSKPLSTTFPPPLNRHVSYDKVNIPERSMRPSTSLSALTGERSEIPHLRPTPSLHEQRWIDSENNRWQERSAERNRAKESMRLDIPPEYNFPPRDRTSSSNGRSFISSNEQEYSFEIAGPSRLGGTVPPPLASPHGNLPRHPNDSPRSSYSAREPSSSRVLETDPFNHRPALHAQQHGGNNPAGLPVPQPPSRPIQPGRRASSDYGGTPYPTSYSPPYHQNKKGDERYSFRPPSDHYSAQNNSRTPSGYYRDEYRDDNHHDHSYVSGDESGSGSMGFRPSKYRKRSRAPAPGSCVSCGVRDTPEWRRGPNGARTLCNACGLHFSKLLRRKKQEQGNDSANVTVEELRSSLKLPGNGSTGQMSPSF